MQIFDLIRQQNASWYTTNPILDLTEIELAELAAQANLTVAELRQQASTPSIRQTCPLCGLPQTHLSLCKGCGSGSFGFELEQAYPPNADGVTIIQHLRSALAAALGPVATDDQITAAIAKAFQYGGCMICADCWQMTSTNWHAYLTCPLFLLHETATGTAHADVIGLIVNGVFDPAAWRQRVIQHWAGAQFRPDLAAWRSALLTPALADAEKQQEHITELIKTLQSD